MKVTTRAAARREQLKTPPPFHIETFIIPHDPPLISKKRKLVNYEDDEVTTSRSHDDDDLKERKKSRFASVRRNLARDFEACESIVIFHFSPPQSPQKDLIRTTIHALTDSLEQLQTLYGSMEEDSQEEPFIVVD